jgi:hypothetical protein
MDDAYLLIKEFHSLFRWLVLALSVIVVMNFVLGAVSKKVYDKMENLLTLFYIISVDIQLLIGLLLYFVFSPLTRSLFEGISPMDNATTRFYAVEHPIMMLLAIVFAHVGRSVSKRGATDVIKFRRGLIWFGLSLVCMLTRMPWQNL